MFTELEYSRAQKQSARSSSFSSPHHRDRSLFFSPSPPDCSLKKQIALAWHGLFFFSVTTLAEASVRNCARVWPWRCVRTSVVLLAFASSLSFTAPPLSSPCGQFRPRPFTSHRLDTSLPLLHPLHRVGNLVLEASLHTHRVQNLTTPPPPSPACRAF